VITCTDLFCGAGGSSSGAEMVPGVRVRQACNHWALADRETHNGNFPHVDHDVADIAGVDPRRYPSTDLLWASPSCTFWSQAAGRKVDFDDAATRPALFDLATTDDIDDEPLPTEAAERSRALMHDVPRFAEYHRYRAVIVENTLPLLKWAYFGKWIARMRALGYRHRVLTLNSAFAHQLGAPAPQLRDRAYVCFWQERYPDPDFDRWTRPQAWCPACERVVTAIRAPKNPRKPHGAHGMQYTYRCPNTACRNGRVAPYALPAAAAIDWAIPGQRIGDRAEPLAAKTVARIEAGLARYAQPVTVEAAGHTFERRAGVWAWPVSEPLRTLHTTTSKALACPPFLAPLRSGRSRTSRASDPLATLVADGSNHALLVPVEGRDGKTAAPVAYPVRTQTGRNETGLLVPTGGTWNTAASSTEVPMRTRTTRETEAIVIPLRNHNQAKLAGEDPFDTFAAAGQHHALLVRNNGTREAGRDGMICTPAGEPLRTLTTGGHQSLVTWDPDLMVPYDRTSAARRTSEPMPTQTTVEGDGLLESGLSVEDCLFRMLMPSEIKAGMAFAEGFRLLGNKREQVRMCGNAVTPPVARDLIACLVEAITGQEMTAA
jgi:DNA (cytosine-5)-methyltransferase 1